MHSMRPIAAETLCKNDWTDRGPLRVSDSLWRWEGSTRPSPNYFGLLSVAESQYAVCNIEILSATTFMIRLKYRILLLLLLLLRRIWLKRHLTFSNVTGELYIVSIGLDRNAKQRLHRITSLLTDFLLIKKNRLSFWANYSAHLYIINL